jgi:hypothetical protein
MGTGVQSAPGRCPIRLGRQIQVRVGFKEVEEGADVNSIVWRGVAAITAMGFLAACPEPPETGDDDDDDDATEEVEPGPDGCDTTLNVGQFCGWYDSWYDPFFGEEPCPEFWEDLPGGDGEFRDALTVHQLPLEELSIEPFPTYIEQRGEEDRYIIQSVGTKCAEAADPVACVAEFDAMLSDTGFYEGGCHPGFCWTYLKVNRGDENWLINSGDSLAAAIPTLQTEADAGLWMQAEVEYLEGGAQVREVGDSWQYVVFYLVDWGPTMSHKALIELRPDRSWEVLRSAVHSIGCDEDL